MKYRPDARHGQHRIHPATRVLIWRSVGVGIGFLVSTVGVAIFAMWTP